ncbi:2-amino-3,7-dideoxy-D-threo-hept-6-ulosonate synthase [Goodfellowiella coeruleoviolacea]|uniref:2-amino-4, 5-dihydroxy-6-oxo-7-(Phosphonooxy)heptanoate synthase n=1 Tax=Goodfellowiella coeruleoviolacea TaxID=334858 RepID=A0AAE3G8H6_9PSEU|nr:2-amino-3,7-dideoxy-D-threo-hept-6-ulosonate synthase [Goodfellowiella coeruleoviolacea]MCP2163661.1 2-amino-4,5-dihydroxy-6-oxo-7-(phosphonooxy)heptanoate synthase [Goodfellowiella coeruleoviolacea]
MADTRKAFRLRRLSRQRDGRHLFVPLDHSVSDGPVVPNQGWDALVRDVAMGGADAVIVHKGRARAIDPELLGDCALVVHLSAGTAHAADVNAKVLVGEVEDALRLGADAVSVHVNIGSDTEQRQLADLGAVAGSCDAWNVPLLVMAYARGPRVASSHDPALLAHVVNIAADLGADLVKTSMALPVERMAEVTGSCPIPVLAAGGPADGADLVAHGHAAMAAGCRGLAVGRRIFSAPNPLSLVRRLAEVVHQDTDPLTGYAPLAAAGATSS